MALQYPGEYPQPQTRHQEIRAPIVPGFATARLGAIPTLEDLGTNLEVYQTAIVVENTGDAQVTVQLKQMPSYVSGPRENIGPAMVIAPAGTKSTVIYPDQKYLELWGAGLNNSSVRMSIDSRIRWQVMGFSRTDTVYPAILWEAVYPDIDSLT